MTSNRESNVAICSLESSTFENCKMVINVTHIGSNYAPISAPSNEDEDAATAGRVLAPFVAAPSVDAANRMEDDEEEEEDDDDYEESDEDDDESDSDSSDSDAEYF